MLFVKNLDLDLNLKHEILYCTIAKSSNWLYSTFEGP
jgi:hypothetical protein